MCGDAKGGGVGDGAGVEGSEEEARGKERLEMHLQGLDAECVSKLRWDDIRLEGLRLLGFGTFSVSLFRLLLLLDLNLVGISSITRLSQSSRCTSPLSPHSPS